MADFLGNPQGTGPQAVPMKNGSATGGGSKPTPQAQRMTTGSGSKGAKVSIGSSRPAHAQKLRG